MHDYLLSGEWVRFAFVLGIAVSMVMYEKRHLTTGSIVVPGYIAVFVIHPLVIIATFINSLLTYAFVNKFLTKHFLLYGRTKFTVLAVTSTAIQTVMLRLSPSGTWLWEMDIPIFIGVGYIVPALIAHDMARQGIKKTAKSVMMAGLIVLVPIAIALLLDLPGVNDLSPVSGFGNTAIDPKWLPFAIVLSVLSSWAVAHNYGLRSGGFVGAALVGMFMGDPLQVVVAVVIAAITYVIVAKYLMRHMILFGRRKFSSMLLVSSAIAWICLWSGDRFLPVEWEQRLGVGSLALTPLLLPGLLANDAQRTSPSHVLRGVVLAGTFAVTTTWWVQSIVEGSSLNPLWKIISIASSLVLYQKQIVTFVRSRSGAADEDHDETTDVLTEVGVEFSRETAPPEPATPAMVEPVTPALELVESPYADLEGATTEGDAAEIETPAVIRPAVAEAEPAEIEDDIVAAPAATSNGGSDWDEWADANPLAAEAATRWLDDQLAEIRGSHPAAAEVATPAQLFDFDTGLVLEDALVADRGLRPVPRRTRTDDRPRREHREISETSDAAREAQLVASDVSDDPRTAPPDGERSATTWSGRSTD